MIAISYSGGGSQTVSLYRNGSAYASYVTGTQTFTSSFVDALIGLRHEHNSGNFGTATGTDAFLAALVNEARIYDTALTASEISDLYAAGPLAIPEPRGLSLLLLACAAATAAIRARTT